MNVQIVATAKAKVVSASKSECEALVEKIVQDKRTADEQQKQVNAEAEKIGREAAEANEIARVVQAELDRALPALQAAEDALNVLTKKDISELKAYAKPPGLVELTLQGARTQLLIHPSFP
jgi:dynein heavy chain, axonemal